MLFISKLIIYNATIIPNVSKKIRKHEDIWKTGCQNFIHIQDIRCERDLEL